LICEKVLRERDDTSSAIRIVDLFDLPANADGHPVRVVINALTLMKSRKQTGPHTFTMRVVFPDGTAKDVNPATGDNQPLEISFGTKAPEFSVLFGAQVLIQINLETAGSGVFMLQALLEGTVVAETPLTLRVRNTR
jgi:hypothetical protein